MDSPSPSARRIGNALIAPQYSQKQVLEALPDISFKTLQNWKSRGLIDDHGYDGGKGRKFLYSADDVVRIAMMREMVSYGLAPSSALVFIGRLAEYVNFYISEEQDRRALLYKIGDRHCVCLETTEALHGPVVGLYFVLKIDDIAREVLKKLAACRPQRRARPVRFDGASAA